jgi:hypothetical protein
MDMQLNNGYMSTNLSYWLLNALNSKNFVLDCEIKFCLQFKDNVYVSRTSIYKKMSENIFPAEVEVHKNGHLLLQLLPLRLRAPQTSVSWRVGGRDASSASISRPQRSSSDFGPRLSAREADDHPCEVSLASYFGRLAASGFSR